LPPVQMLIHKNHQACKWSRDHVDTPIERRMKS